MATPSARTLDTTHTNPSKVTPDTFHASTTHCTQNHPPSPPHLPSHRPLPNTQPIKPNPSGVMMTPPALIQPTTTNINHHHPPTHPIIEGCPDRRSHHDPSPSPPHQPPPKTKPTESNPTGVLMTPHPHITPPITHKHHPHPPIPPSLPTAHPCREQSGDRRPHNHHQPPTHQPQTQIKPTESNSLGVVMTPPPQNQPPPHTNNHHHSPTRPPTLYSLQ